MHAPTPRPFAWWATPTQRAHGAPAQQAIPAPARRPFSKPNAGMPPALGSALKTAQVFQFPQRKPV